MPGASNLPTMRHPSRRAVLAALGTTATGAAVGTPLAGGQTGTPGWRSYQGGPANSGWVPGLPGTADGADEEWEATTSAAFGQPVVDEGAAYVNTAAGAVRAYDVETGELRWETTPGGREASVPAVGGDGTVYVTTDEAVVALDPDTGAARTLLDSGGTFGTADTRGPAPTVARGTLYVVADGRLHALAAPDGDELWSAAAPAAVGAPAAASTGVYAGATLFDPKTGERRWSVDINLVHPPAATDRTVYVVTDAGLEARDAADGTRRWRFGRVELQAPAVDDGTVYVGGVGDGSGLYALDAGTGTVEWSENSGYLGGPPVVAGDSVYALMPGPSRATSDDYWWGLRAFDRDAGEELWGAKLRDKNGVGSIAVAADGEELYAVAGGRLHRLTPTGGDRVDDVGPALEADDPESAGEFDTRWYRAAALWAAVQVTGPLALGGLVALADRLADAGDGLEADPDDEGDGS
jgi:outer membrane protein assembly factor BamB